MNTHSVWIEINTKALEHNLAQVRNHVGPQTRIMAVVKANAYGHGAVETARIFSRSANYLGVTTLEEGLELRAAGISLPILVFSPLLADQTESAVDADLELTVCDAESGQAVASAIDRVGKRARVHLKVDTGMGRLGVNPDDCPNLMYSIIHLGGIEISGIYTHFANSGSSDLTHARKQNSVFAAAIDSLRTKDIPTGLRHASNSAAVLNMPEARYDMVRPGTILYGQYPSRSISVKLDLHDTWCLKSRVTSIRHLPAGVPVGYGSEFTTKRPTLAAVIPVGYSEGFSMIPESLARRSSTPLRAVASKLLGKSNTPFVTIRGVRAPVIGRISMQMCSIDVTDIPDVRTGDEVVIPARRVTTSSRIPRIYV